MAELKSGVTHDTVYDGRVHLVQPMKGFRANMDSLLLAASVSVKDGGLALEVGCGCGGALLPAAYRLPEVQFTGIDIDADMAALAHAGVEKNGFHSRVSVETGGVSDWVKPHENRFDAVFSNPPYFAPGSISQPGEGRESAYLESLALEDWIKAMMFAAKPRAPITLIHRAAELARILACFDKWTGEITVLPIQPHAGGDANRILVRGRKGLKRGRVRLLAGLALHDTLGGALTPPAAKALNGAALDW